MNKADSRRCGVGTRRRTEDHHLERLVSGILQQAARDTESTAVGVDCSTANSEAKKSV